MSNSNSSNNSGIFGSSSSSDTASPAFAIPKEANISTHKFSDEPLLLRLDIATHGFYRELKDATDKRLMEIIANTANVNVRTRPAGKKEFTKYNKPGEGENTRNVRLKYRLREELLRQSGTFDLQWGIKWLLSFVALLDTPVLNLAEASRLLELVDMWLKALVSANIHEIVSELPAMEDTIAIAQDEMLCQRTLSEKLPGQFNSACSLLFAGELKTNFIDANMPKWVLELRARDSQSTERIGARGRDVVPSLSIAEAQECVSGIVPLDTGCKSSGAVDLRINSIGNDGDSNGDGLVQVGVYVFDRQHMADKGEQLMLRFEPEIAMEMRVGFVLEATLHTLDNGCNYIDAVTMVWPSYTPLDYVEMF
ncbi:hypothetical protein COEREDRAFT_79707 [Coemansia reversa NRRL 1564]|uniref:Uncharacterized protein n=1 Tax=Coemansia reversa (strain ATCC 12441 / NRRL 1564) TaxID=763665 RepID=A0A2G5BI72_COERN|nr:hypothetical protein COEREDRAFT_79707 [Coemansia reversa NRRL 1564]|eukprot:PIA18709.1 hypothetical protein COEREDRAFT_79707 [Coemansia reversa NRRL 1564]